VTLAMSTVDEQYAAAKRTYNTDAPERSSTSPQACRKELSSYAAFNSKRLRRAPNPDDELAKYKGITDQGFPQSIKTSGHLLPCLIMRLELLRLVVWQVKGGRLDYLQALVEVLAKSRKI
jgi:hypothetical protein